MTPPAAASTVRPAAPLAPRRRPVAAPRPRRVSGPARPAARPPVRPTVSGAPASADSGLLLGLLGALESVSSHRLLDRLIRGRLWIGIVAFALIGIVTLQLGLLKLNSGIGRALEREASLQRENAALSIEDSELTGGGRVESQASRLGMQLMSIGSLRFLASHAHTDIAQAATALRAPLKPSAEAGGEAGATTATTPTTGAEEQSSASSSGAAEAPTQSQATGGGEAQAPTSAAAQAPSGSGETSPSPTTSNGTPSSAEGGGGTAAPAG